MDGLDAVLGACLRGLVHGHDVDRAEQLYDLGEKFAAYIKGSPATDDENASIRVMIDADVEQALPPLPPLQLIVPALAKVPVKLILYGPVARILPEFIVRLVR